MWVTVEKDLTYPHPIQAFITQTDSAIPNNNPVIAFSQETWPIRHTILGSDHIFHT